MKVEKSKTTSKVKAAIQVSTYEGYVSLAGTFCVYVQSLYFCVTIIMFFTELYNLLSLYIY